ncbi:hypothetical protein C8Q76DRAFT_301318 [Earliella scabrosa]|nr:hypothetical protein C8Q76DRAFT_301318 [Earliella scabrosa]
MTRTGNGNETGTSATTTSADREKKQPTEDNRRHRRTQHNNSDSDMGPKQRRPLETTPTRGPRLRNHGSAREHSRT